MENESSIPAVLASGSVFLSYASQDAEPANRICNALRTAGIEVWFDQSELRGGDVWDQKIRSQIHDCRLFIPVISANTEGRDEGYFRREWRLAVERAGDMHEKRTFLVPIVIDETDERGAAVPDRFRQVQWTRLPGGEASQAFVERIKRLLSLKSQTAGKMPAGPAATHVIAGRPVTRRWFAAVAVVGAVVALAYMTHERLGTSSGTSSPRAASTVQAPAARPDFAPPAHSIAVLPFTNLSADKDEEYFADGITEELINSLAQISALQVAARTSSFYFKGKEADLRTISRALNVASVLEGSVRRSERRIRITAQLSNAVTGFHLWSRTYDRDLGDLLKLQTEIATEVADALKVTLLGDVAAKIELGGTANTAALEAYLRGRTLHQGSSHNSMRDAIGAYTDAIRLDPNFALAYVNRSLAYGNYAGDFDGAPRREINDKALRDAQEALALAPELADGYVALGEHFQFEGELARAKEAYARATTLAPGNARVLRVSGLFAVMIGQTETGLTALHQAAALDPLNPNSFRLLSKGLYFARQYQESITAAEHVISLNPAAEDAYITQGLAYYGLGDFEHARAACERTHDLLESQQQCLALTYDKVGRHADAEALLAKFEAAKSGESSYICATIYAQWGNTDKALEWLQRARMRDPRLWGLKTDPLMEPLLKEPRFQAIARELKHPE